MSRTKALERVKLTKFDDLFGAKETELATEIGEFKQVSISELHKFHNHPFKIREDKLLELADSIKAHGVLVPGIVRRKQYGGYEIIAGHTRKRACELAGITKMPVIIKDIGDDEATIIMVDSNIQREDIFPSEKAKAYKMKYDAMKNQGKAGNSLRQIGEETGENYKAVQRYIWLARLSDELLEWVDTKRLGFGQGVDLSWLNEMEQNLVYKVLQEKNRTLSVKESAIIKELSKGKKLDEVSILQTLIRKKGARKVSLDQKKLDVYFTPDVSEQEIMDIILSLLDKWKTERGDA